MDTTGLGVQCGTPAVSRSGRKICARHRRSQNASVVLRPRRTARPERRELELGREEMASDWRNRRNRRRKWHGRSRTENFTVVKEVADWAWAIMAGTREAGAPEAWRVVACVGGQAIVAGPCVVAVPACTGPMPAAGQAVQR
jgi:hypothetical protein